MPSSVSSTPNPWTEVGMSSTSSGCMVEVTMKKISRRKVTLAVGLESESELGESSGSELN